MFQLAVRLWADGKMLYPVKFSVMYDVAGNKSSVRAFVKNDKVISTDYMLITPFISMNGSIFEKDIIVIDGDYNTMRVVDFNPKEGVYQAVNIKDDNDIVIMTSKYEYEVAGNTFEDLDLVAGTKYERKETTAEPVQTALDNKAADEGIKPVKESITESVDAKPPLKEEPKGSAPGSKENKGAQDKKDNGIQQKPENHGGNPERKKKKKKKNRGGDKQDGNNQQSAVNNGAKPAHTGNNENPEKQGHNDSMHAKEKDMPAEKPVQADVVIKEVLPRAEGPASAAGDPQEEKNPVPASNDTVKEEVHTEEAKTKEDVVELDSTDSKAAESATGTGCSVEEKEPVTEEAKDVTPAQDSKPKAKEIQVAPLSMETDGQMTFTKPDEPDESDYFNESEEKSPLKNKEEKAAKAELHFVCDCDGHRGAYVFAVVSRGMEETFFGEEENTGQKKIVLQGLVDALSYFEGNFNVTVYTDSQYVVYPFMKGWINKWKNNNWYKNDTDKIQDFELWSQLLELSNRLHVKWQFTEHQTEHMERCSVVLKKNM